MTTHRSLFRGAALTAAAVTASLALTACGDDDASGGHNGHGGGSSSSASPKKDGNHNKADVDFATGMIPHHRQAVEMSDLAASRASSGQVKDLAKKIEKAQAPEIRTMSGWLESWGEKVPEDMSGMEHGDMDHGNHGDPGDGSGMPGMTDRKQMEELEKSSGKTFDTRFLTMMVEHHKGAVEMARTEKKHGTYGPAKKLADEVITAQTSEITRMNKLLGKG
ncbi:DUF305 domain-containing protein [Streptomyces albus subsp. chlorinus]|uniref:DUF305 domain-containing protein n=1 Tax=Streptomyces albus TaxID=1888 RepID=UPI00156EED54|nr:DUF305 domain-containing protein [Streptomyces albus]NSC24008.1 DUF305 domain-containing protein [Streptomyces albus subsp. chlorinus]